MTKVFKITRRLFSISFEWILILFIGFAFLIRLSAVQTYLAQLATDFLSNELKTTVRVDRVSIVFVDRIALEGILLLDLKKDTIASIQTIYVTLDNIDFEKRVINLRHAGLEKGTIHLSIDKKTGDNNFDFIVDYFASEKSSPTTNSPFNIFLSSLNLSEINFKYDDFRFGYSKFGMDYDHLDLRKISMDVDHIKVIDDVIHANISHLEARERCGFVLEDFSGRATVSSKNVLVDELKIRTPFTRAYLPTFGMLYNDFEDYLYFEDSVSFDAVIQKSSVALKDISYFAPAMEGMDNQVDISAIVTKKVKDLKLTNLDLKLGEKTIVRGTINLPDFRAIEHTFFNEKIDYAFVSLDDLKAFHLPIDAGGGNISFEKHINRFGFFEAEDLRVDGFYSQFVVAADNIRTELGAIKMDNGIMFTQNPSNESYLFERSAASEYDVKIDRFQLGKFLDDPNFKEVDGTFFLSGEAFSIDDIRFNLLEGNVNRFDYLGYAYENIFIREGSFTDNIFTAKVQVKDDNLNLEYDGFIDFNGEQHMLFTIDLTRAVLDNLGISANEKSSLESRFTVDLRGNSANSLYGSLVMNGILYKEAGKEIAMPSLTVNVKRGEEQDVFSVKSQLADLTIQGKVDFTTLVADFSSEFEKVFPSIFPKKAKLRALKRKSSTSHFSYSLVTHDLTDFLAIFVPKLSISPETSLKGSFDARSSSFNTDILSKEIIYSGKKFNLVKIEQQLSAEEVTANYSVEQFIFNDSLSFEHLAFNTLGKENVLHSTLSWNPATNNESIISWRTDVLDNKNVHFTLNPSFFSIHEQRWDIENQSDIGISEYTVTVGKLKLQNDKQYVTVDGKFSNNDEDKLNFRIHEIDLHALSELIGSQVELKGVINGWAYISNPYTNLAYMGDAAIQRLSLNQQEVGDIFVQSEWNKKIGNVDFTGDLVYRGNQTLQFDGQYLLKKETDNLDFNLVFDKTDLRFINAFVDDEIATNIQGLLDGRIKVGGTPDFPELKGNVELIGGNAKMTILGVNVALNGKIAVDKYGFYMNHAPITDEEGNTGSVVGSVYHNQFKDWNYDVLIDLKTRSQPISRYFIPSQQTPSDRFLVLNTTYKEGEMYYGKAFATGKINLTGTEENISISVNAETRKGTQINFPMYGTAELDEEDTFIVFKKSDSTLNVQAQKIDFTGVDLDLNFRVTPDAKLRIIFDEQTNDEINATGRGDLSVKVNNLGDLALNGVFEVTKGLYNFSLGGIIKQPFTIQEGGTIAWIGDPYNATIDLKAYYTVNANISDISPDKLNGVVGSNQKINCYLLLSESLMKPTIGFDIKAPKANENDKALLARVTADPDELNSQFFSLLILNRFKPQKGVVSSNNTSALDIVSNQINSILSQISKDYKLNVDLASDNTAGSNKMAVGLTKGFLDDRLIFAGSFGVENRTAASTSSSSSALIGNVSLEYLINESGTLRITVFNESNNYAIIQEKNVGQFTQGAGVNYQEEFNSIKDFKLVQYFLDIFRSKSTKRYPIKHHKQQKAVPILPKDTVIVILDKKAT